MHPIILHDLIKAHTGDLHRQAERDALSLAARRARHAQAAHLTRLTLRDLVEGDVPGAGAGAWLRTFVKLRGERGGPRWSVGSG